MRLEAYSMVIAAILLAATPALAQTMLVTPEEAARPLPAQAPDRGGIFPGPSIVVTSPTTEALLRPLSSPFRLTIAFHPHNSAAIDLSKVKLIYLRSPNADLTARILKSVSADGIDMANVVLPPGQHLFRVIVADSRGELGATTFSLTVAR